MTKSRDQRAWEILLAQWMPPQVLDAAKIIVAKSVLMESINYVGGTTPSETKTKMTSKDLINARVVGFFSLPSASMAGTNPETYNLAWRNAPAGAGSCALCGQGILHHVSVKLDSGPVVFIGSDCAERVGEPEIARAVSAFLTTEQLMARDMKQAEERAAFIDRQRMNGAARAFDMFQRAARFSEALQALNAQGTDFHFDLADAVLVGYLSDRQAEYVCRAVFGRLTKKTNDAWEELHNALTEREEPAA